jgi:hypothetical protein
MKENPMEWWIKSELSAIGALHVYIDKSCTHEEEQPEHRTTLGLQIITVIPK